MATPFGGHPTLQKYLNWLLEQGFSYKTGYYATSSSNGGKILPTVRIEKDGQPMLVIVGVRMDDRLAPSEVERFDRRLEVASPFPKTPR